MGLFDFLKKDPRKVLEKAAESLAKGDPQRALEHASKIDKDAALPQQQEAERIVREARAAIAQRALEKAQMTEEAGFLADAADWLRSALETIDDEAKRGEIEARIENLAQRAQDEADEAEAERIRLLHEDDGVIVGDHDGELHPDDIYATLTGMLREDLIEHYENRPEAFRDAFLALNEGRGEDALQALKALAEADPDDPVVHLELGRSRLAAGELDEARQDLEIAWERFGPEPLDLAGGLSIPGLWAEAMLGLERPDDMVDRLSEVVDPRGGDADLCNRYALGLILAKRGDDARNFLVRAANYMPRDPRFPYHLAGVLRAEDNIVGAIDCLEAAIEPACKAGCAKGLAHLPSFRALVGLYLDDGRDLKRAEWLLDQIGAEQRSQLTADDELLWAELHKQRGDDEAAQEALERAKELKAAVGVHEVSAVPSPSGPKVPKSVL